MNFPLNYVTFWCPGVLWVTLGGSLDPGPHFFMILDLILEAPGATRGTLGAPCGPYWEVMGDQKDTFCGHFLDLGAELTFSSIFGTRNAPQMMNFEGSNVMKT